MKILPCHGTAWKNSPLMGFDHIQPETLRHPSVRSGCEKGLQRTKRNMTSTYLSNLLLSHAMLHISLVQKDQKTSPHQPLVVVSRDCASSSCGGDQPLPRAGRPAPGDNHQLVADQWHRPPRPACLSSQSSFSSRIGVFFGLPRPLGEVSLATNRRGKLRIAHRC